MAHSRAYLAVGLMSGTSMDGIDAALLRTDGEDLAVPLAARSFPYPSDVRIRLEALVRNAARNPAERAAVEEVLTELHARAVHGLLAETGLPRPDLAGFHGHTVLHRPAEGRSLQIGDGPHLARRLGCPVVWDFRSADLAAGGEGAPLAPIYHACVTRGLERPLAVLNVGGVANLTWIGEGGQLLAFDTGPGNAPIDDWSARHLGRPCDEDGRLAAAGRVDDERLEAALGHPFFDRPPPKSLDRQDFPVSLVEGLAPADGAATLTALAAAAVARARRWLPAPPRRWLVTGGGRRNPVLMAMLAARLEAPVTAIEAVGADGDALEAQCFAYLAVRVLRGLPTSFPTTTGARTPVCGGRIARP
ncbi:MAG TPA: anhydro-N-acetylmuramic acid kinase [Rhodospirillales bacterium]|nr:anhydro-N-acetylmuramic acid kinase [Rhodospirillales bacterium]